MKIAVLSDIHANYLALTAVLAHAEKRSAERFWFLGDVVGYGPQPVECIDWLRQNVALDDWVLGNHDAMLVGLDVRDHWHGPAQAHEAAKLQNYFALREVREVELGSNRDPITALQIHWSDLSAHPAADAYWRSTFNSNQLGPKELKCDGVYHSLVHASRLPNAQLGAYIYPWSFYLLRTELEALAHDYSAVDAPVCQWHGHTHVAYLLALDHPDQVSPAVATCIEFGKPYPLGQRATLINPGSVGQPRHSQPDGSVMADQRACYALLDTLERTVSFYRVAYNVHKAIGLLEAGGYPNGLVKRLSTAEWPTGGDKQPSPDWAACLQRQQELL